jgi:hypothetical protein
MKFENAAFRVLTGNFFQFPNLKQDIIGYTETNFYRLWFWSEMSKKRAKPRMKNMYLVTPC